MPKQVPSASSRSFHERLEAALGSPTLGPALHRAMAMSRQRRAEALAFLDFDRARDDLIARKDRAIARLPDLVHQFQVEAERVGAVVHHAATAEEACRIVGELLARSDARLVVKSKSMVTEEIGLNGHLMSRGIKVVETDLGEWIIQLAGETPSHITVPAIHKTREDIAALFRREFGVPISSEIPDLVRFAREQLRQSFIAADAGISGANVAIAESGTLVILTNEGNGRLVTTLPPVHIAVLGVEKIVPTLDDATAIIKLLPGSATGQKITSYVSFITGPSRTSDIERQLTIGAHGPRDLHIVLVDNGRYAAREDPQFRDVLRCIKCGACASVCPSYEVVGGHAFGHIYTGPIGLLATALHHGLDRAAEPLSLCASCNACDTVCPVGIPIASLIVELRRRWTERHGVSLAKRVAIDVLGKPSRLGRWRAAARLAQSPPVKALLSRVPAFDQQLAWRNLPIPVASRRAVDEPSAEHDALLAGSRANGLKVVYFPGCIADGFCPEIGAAILKVLRACGVQVIVPSERPCCGLPAINAGDHARAFAMARHSLDTLEPLEADYILSGSASCVVAIKNDYPRLFDGHLGLLDRSRALASRVVDFTSFMHDVVVLPAGALAASTDTPVTYHDSCQSHNCLGLSAQPRHLLRAVCGLELREMADSSACCGFGGLFSLDHPEVARRITQRKLDAVSATGSPIVVADNPGCIMHMRLVLGAQGMPTKVLHVAELMADRLDAVAEATANRTDWRR